MSEFDPYHKWFGISKKDQPPHHYRLLGLDLFETDADVIDVAANKQMRTLKEYGNGEHAELSQRLLNEVATARLCLLNAGQKTRYDETLKAKLAAGQPAAGERPPPGSSLPAAGGSEPTLRPSRVHSPANADPIAAGSSGPGRERSRWIVISGTLAGVLICGAIGVVLLNRDDAPSSLTPKSAVENRAIAQNSQPGQDAGGEPGEISKPESNSRTKKQSASSVGGVKNVELQASAGGANVDASRESPGDSRVSDAPAEKTGDAADSETLVAGSDLAATAKVNLSSGVSPRMPAASDAAGNKSNAAAKSEIKGPVGKVPVAKVPETKGAEPDDGPEDADANNKLYVREAFTLRRHEAAVTRVTFHPGQPLLCSTGKDGRVLLWNLEQRSPVELVKFNEEAWAARFSPNGAVVAYGNRNGRGSVVRIKSLGTGKVVKSLGGFKDGGGSVASMAFSPDALLFVVGQDNGTIRLWETASYKEAPPLPVSNGVFALAFGPIERDSKKKVREYLLAAGGKNGSVKTLRAAFLQEKKGVHFEFEPTKVEFPLRKAVTSLRFSPDGKLLGSTHHGGAIVLSDPETGKLVRILKASDGSTESISFHPARPWIVTAHWQDHCAKIWNIETGLVLCELKGHTDGVLWAEFSRDGRQVATASGDFSVKLWNLEGPGISMSSRGSKTKKLTAPKVGD